MLSKYFVSHLSEKVNRNVYFFAEGIKCIPNSKFFQVECWVKSEKKYGMHTLYKLKARFIAREASPMLGKAL